MVLGRPFPVDRSSRASTREERAAAGRWHPAVEATLVGSLMGHPEFFSFGTNDLTQMTFGFSRDDIGGFVPDYHEPVARLAAAQAQLTQPRGKKTGPGVRGPASAKAKRKAGAKAAAEPKTKAVAKKRVTAKPGKKAAKAKVVAKPKAKSKARSKAKPKAKAKPRTKSRR